MVVARIASRRRVWLFGAAVACASALLGAQSPVQSCNATPKPAWCAAVPATGRRAGWRSGGPR